MAFRESPGNWKENVITQKWPMACTTLKTIMGNQWTTLMHGIGNQITECPIPPVKTLIVIITIQFDLDVFYCYNKHTHLISFASQINTTMACSI